VERIGQLNQNSSSNCSNLLLFTGVFMLLETVLILLYIY